jgi:ABC-type sugar transport system ATPase subunit
MHIIILEGPKGSGKTTTLQMVYAVLKLFNATVTSPPKHIINSSKRDFEAELLFQNKTVAIFSKGDTQSDCITAIQNYAGKNFDVLIIAHTSNLLPLTNNPPTTSHTTVTIQKTVPPNHFEEISSHIGDCLNIIINI